MTANQQGFHYVILIKEDLDIKRETFIRIKKKTDEKEIVLGIGTACFLYNANLIFNPEATVMQTYSRLSCFLVSSIC